MAILLLAVQHGRNNVKLPLGLVVVLLALAGAGCDRFGPSEASYLRAVDAPPLEVTVTQTAQAEDGEQVTKQLGQFEAPWRTSFLLDEAAQTPISFTSTLEVEVQGAAPMERTPVFLILRSNTYGREGRRLHLRVFYPAEGSTVKHFQGAFSGTAYAFFARDIGERTVHPLRLTLKGDESSPRELSLDPKDHTLDYNAALHFDLGDLGKQDQDAGQTAILIRNPLSAEWGTDPLPIQPLILIYNRSRQLTFQPDFESGPHARGTFYVDFLEPLSPDFECYIFMVNPADPAPST